MYAVVYKTTGAMELFEELSNDYSDREDIEIYESHLSFHDASENSQWKIIDGELTLVSNNIESIIPTQTIGDLLRLEIDSV